MEILLTPWLLRAAMPQASERNVTRFAPELAKVCAQYNITGALRTAHFLAQVAQESGQLAFTEELASGAAYEGRADLGNVEPGDGVRFKGRGLIQITGRSNYRAYAHACGQDLLSGTNASRVSTDTTLAANVAGWFWQVHGLNALADSDDVVRITRRINGGQTGLSQRQTFLRHAKAAIGGAAESPATATPPAHSASPATSAAVVGRISAVATCHATTACAVTDDVGLAASRRPDDRTLGAAVTKQDACENTRYRNAA